jgi:hypothetical protein
MDSVDTIFALSSGAPPAAIAVVRISGAQAFKAVRLLTGTLPPPRKASLRKLKIRLRWQPSRSGPDSLSFPVLQRRRERIWRSFTCMAGEQWFVV